MLGDAYVSVDEVDELLPHIADTSAWSAATENQQTAALMQASDEIDSLNFAGIPYGDYASGVIGTQTRAFPRFVADDPSQWLAGKATVTGRIVDMDADGDPVIPDQVKLVVLWQALTILANPTRPARLADQHDGVTGQSAGGISESYDAARRPILVCLQAMRLLERYLLKTGRIL